jgi:hypothetical protein
LRSNGTASPCLASIEANICRPAGINQSISGSVMQVTEVVRLATTPKFTTDWTPRSFFRGACPAFFQFQLNYTWSHALSDFR